MTSKMIPELARRYLAFLGVEPGPPGLALLRNLVRRHLERIPFENISKLYYLKKYGLRGVPELELYLGGIERYHFGGTCYSNNVYLNGLLRFLGFDIDLCGADMSDPDVHIVNLVRVGGREYLVDVGYGAPFFEPMPRDRTANLVVAMGNEQWVVLPPDEYGRTEVEHHRQGERIHGYVARPIPREPEHFAQVVSDSFRDDSTFMKTIRLVRYLDNGCIAVTDNVVYTATQETSLIRRLAGYTELTATIENEFAIPSAVVNEATAGLRNS